MIGKVKESAITENRNGSKKVMMILCEIADPDDLQNVELMTSAGMDYRPHPNARVYIVEAGKAYKIAVAADDGIEPTVGEGEFEIYSHNSSGAKLARVKCRSTGAAQINGGSNHAVQYEALKVAFDQLKTDFDNFVTITYNLHNHPTAPPGPVSVPSVTGSSSTADMSPSEISDIEVP